MTSYFAETKLTNGSEDEEYYFLQPMFQKLPPNEILSQKYAPDVTTQIKLMPNKDQRKNNLHFIPPKSKNAQLETYAEQFNIFDYLGKQYADKINQIVYFKFNNAKYNITPEAKLKTRIMPAFYIPFQHIYSQSQAFFTKNIGLNFPQTCNNSSIPSPKHNRGCSFDPIFCSSYQSANLFAAIRKNPFQYDLILQNDINSCQSVYWFNFSVQFCHEGYYSFRIVNFTEDMSKLFEQGMKVSYFYLNNGCNKFKKNGEGWGLCGQNIKFSKGNVDIENKRGKKYYELYFQFKCKNKHDIVMFSLDVPYSILEYEKFFNKILFKKIKNMLKIEKKQFGRTISGSPLVSYQISRKKMRGDSVQVSPQTSETKLHNKDKRKSANLIPISQSLNMGEIHHKSIIILGRSQSSDTNSSFVIQGMIDYLLDSMQIQSMKRVFDFYFIPLVNIDGVKHGNSKSNLTGSLLNNNWKTPHRQYQAQTYYLKEYLQEINKQNPISLVINLKSQRQDIYSTFMGVKNQSEESEDSRIFPFILSRRNRHISFEKSIFFNRNQNNSMCCALNELFSKALIYQVNVSHFQISKKQDESLYSSRIAQNDIKQCNTQNYRMFGKDLLSYYLQHAKLYDKNILLRDKWVKQIDEFMSKKCKKAYNFPQDKRVEEKFPPFFYQIHPSQQLSIAPQIKSAKQLIPNKPLSSQKSFNLQKIANQMAKRQNKYLLPHSVNDFLSKKSKNEGYMKLNDNKRSQDSQIDLQKPISFAKSGEKKTSILLNCPSSTLNFEIQGDKRHNFVIGKRQKNPIQKQILKKQLSSKLLRKVKIQGSVNRWKGKERLSKQQQFLNNS